MDLAAITRPAVRRALRAVRRAQSLADSPLLRLDLIEVELRRQGMPSSIRTREWALGQVLTDQVEHALAAARAAAGLSPRREPAGEVSREAALTCLQADFRPREPTLEAWSALFHHYLAPVPLRADEVIAATAVSYRTFLRRVTLGCALSVRALRQAELAASRQVNIAPGAPVSQRVLADFAAPAVDVPTAVAELLATVRDNGRVLRLRPHLLFDIVSRRPANLAEYRLGRIAEWSQPRYHLDERFVQLTLSIDRGEQAPVGRWHHLDRHYTSLQEVLQDALEPAFVLLGPPGCGKTTLLRRLELDTAVDGLRDVTDVVTFFVPLNTYRGATTDEVPAPDEWLDEQFRRRYPDLPPLSELLAAGRVILLLDALNEMPHRDTADYRRRVAAWSQFLCDLNAAVKGNRAIFSCRNLDYSAPLSGPALRVPHIHVEAMSDDQIRHFLELYAPREAASLWAQLAGSRQLELLRNPYFLRLFVEETEAKLPGPLGRAGLITGCVRRALRREIERHNELFVPPRLLSERDFERALTARQWRDPCECPLAVVSLPSSASWPWPCSAAWQAAKCDRFG